MPYFIQVEPEQGVTLGPGLTKTPDCISRSGVYSGSNSSAVRRPDFLRKRPLIQREQEDGFPPGLVGE